MAEMTIRLTIDPETGKRNIIIKLDSDPDSLPMEHEEQHRELVEKLINKGLVNAEELGEITIEREEGNEQGLPEENKRGEHGKRQAEGQN